MRDYGWRVGDFWGRWVIKMRDERDRIVGKMVGFYDMRFDKGDRIDLGW